MPYPKGMPILLFDIDGTLVRTGGAGKAAMEAALREGFGVPEIRDVVPFGGRTDPAIGHDLLTVHGHNATPDNVTRLTQYYLERLPAALHKNGGEICPGIRELLVELQPKSNVTLGLLTGNVRAGAEKKLSHFGLWDYFRFGGFGDDHTDRDDVARSAMRAAANHTERIDPSEVWVIGDTALDIKCARAIGAKAVSVATGWVPLDELRTYSPDFAFEDLSDVANLLRLWA
jgi:phosphoglycolate phosphatase